MSTYVVIGLIAIGLGLALFVVAGALLLVGPGGSRARKPDARRASAPAEGRSSAAPLAPASMPPMAEEDDDPHVTTGVLNARDFEDLDDMLAAADALTARGKRDDTT